MPDPFEAQRYHIDMAKLPSLEGWKATQRDKMIKELANQEARIMEDLQKNQSPAGLTRASQDFQAVQVMKQRVVEEDFGSSYYKSQVPQGFAPING